MFLIQVKILAELKPAELAACADLCLAIQRDGSISYDPELDNVISVMHDICTLLHETRSIEFRVVSFGDQPLPVDVRCDLAILMEQMPQAIAALKSETDAFEIDFFEQGIEEKFLFSWLSKETLQITSEDLGSPVEKISLDGMRMMMAAVVKEFCSAAAVVCNPITRHPWYLAWRTSVAE